MISVPGRHSGFTLLEAIVAMVIVSTVGLALYSWLTSNLQILQRIEAATERASAQQLAVDWAQTINPLDQPNGETRLGDYTLSWEGRPLEDPMDGAASDGGPSLYQIALYELDVTVSIPGQEDVSFSMRRVGHEQVRQMDFGGF